MHVVRWKLEGRKIRKFHLTPSVFSMKSVKQAISIEGVNAG